MVDLWVWISKNQEAIIAGVLSSLIAVVIVVALQTTVLSLSGLIVLLVSRRITAARLLGLERASLVYVVSGAIQVERFGELNLVGGPDATAASHMLRTIEDIAPKGVCKHFYCSVPHELFIDEDIVTVGGPRYNTVTRTMLTHLKCGVEFGDDDSLKFLTNRMMEDDKESIDYGVIIASGNPFDDGRRVVVVAGCGSHGVLAAAHLVSTSSRFKKVQRDLARTLQLRFFLKSVNFIAIVRCKYVGNECSSIELVDARRI